MKQIDFHPVPRLLAGLDLVVNAVKVTIGPKGRNVILESGIEPLITNDGGTIARDIQLADKVMNMGAQIARGVIRKTSEAVGGGRTASAILTQAFAHEGVKHIQNGMNINLLRTGMQSAAADIILKMKENAQEITSNDQIKQIATISTESSELGDIIATVINQVGKDCVVTVEESQSFGITSEIVEGLKFDKGYVSPFMVTNDRLECELKDVSVLVTDKKISIFKEIYPVIKKVADEGRNSLVIICEDFDGDALNQSIMMKIAGKFNILAIKAPGFQDKPDWLEDIAVSCGTTVISEKTGVGFDVSLGRAKKVLSTKDSTILIGGNDILPQLGRLEAQLANSTTQWDKDRLQRRIANLQGHIATIKVGAATESELKYLKQKIEDGVNESKRALEEGIIIGGDCAFVNAAKTLAHQPTETPKYWYEIWKTAKPLEFGIGYNIVLDAVHLPLKQIIINAQGNEHIVNDIINSNSQTIGYNALTDKIELDMFAAEIIDAFKVARTVLENALSGASMLLTTSVAIYEETNEKPRLEY